MPEIKGQVAKISTMADGSIRVVVDVQPEYAPDNLLRWVYQDVTILKTSKKLNDNETDQ